MKANKIAITYKSQVYILNRTESNHYQIGFDTDRWSIHIYITQNDWIRIIINKSVRKSKNEYHTQFCYDCYCTIGTSNLYLNEVSDPATCRKIRNMTKWVTIEPMLKEIYNQLKGEMEMINNYQQWWFRLSFDELEAITGIAQDRDANNKKDVRFVNACHLFWENKSHEEKNEIYLNYTNKQDY